VEGITTYLLKMSRKVLKMKNMEQSDSGIVHVVKDCEVWKIRHCQTLTGITKRSEIRKWELDVKDRLTKSLRRLTLSGKLSG